MNRTISFLFFILFSVSLVFGEVPQEAEDEISIATFNIQVFGKSKSNNTKVMQILSNIIRLFDIVAIQEIRDKAGSAIIKLQDGVNLDGSKYNLIVSERLGRTSSKEQYAFLYDSNKIELLPNSYIYDDDVDEDGVNDIDDSENDDQFEREPFIAHFKVKNGVLDFVLINNHIKPDDAEIEISLLPHVVSTVSKYIDETDILIVGDLNADGSYFDEENYLSIFPDDTYIWMIPNSVDNTVAKSDNTYDRIIGTLSISEDYTRKYGVYRFEDYYDFSKIEIESKKISDHYPVWIKLYVDRDTD